jgi:membrane protease YdiL (CAAX protease family)
MENIDKKIVPNRVFPKWWDILVMLLLFTLAQGIFGVVLQAIGFVAPSTSPIDSVDIETYMNEQSALGRYAAIVHLFSFIFSIAILWIYARLRGGKGVIHIRHKSSGFNPSVLLMGVMWLLASQILLEPLLELLPADDDQGIGRGIWAAFTAIISAPILEELLCRGVLFEVLNRRWGVKVSIFISALFFGLLHLSPANAIVALVAGLIFGVLYVRTSSLYATIIIHAINNALAFALINVGMDDVSFAEMLGGGVLYYVVYALAAVLFVGASVEAWFKVLRNKEKLEQ